MKINPNLYRVSCFSDQLKKIRLFRGYKTQAESCKKFGVSSQVWSLWERGIRIPHLDQLIMLCRFFRIELLYFIIPGARPTDYIIPPYHGKNFTGYNEGLRSRKFDH